jgi:hypothetical protein
MQQHPQENTMSNEIVKHQEQQPTALAAVTPRNLDDVSRLAIAVSKSGLYNCRSADDAMVRIITGVELGISPMQALRTIAVVQGKPVLDAALIAGLCMRHHECQSWRVVETTDQRCTIETKHARNGSTRLTYTIEQAQKAGLTGKDNWKHYPSAMLRARCTSALARIAYPDVMAGIYVPDELERSEQPTTYETVVDAEPVTEDPAAEFLARISVADDVQTLGAIGHDVRGARLDQAAKGRIREAYQHRQRELKAAAKARPSAPRASSPDAAPDGPDGVDAEPAPMREPGDDSDTEAA